MAHDGHPHDHDHDHHPHPAIGHNGHGAARQWQTPHLGESRDGAPASHETPDLDLVEAAFVAAFPQAPDPTSFLRLAGVPFIGEAPGRRLLRLLRVEAAETTDIGALTPLLGGDGFRYDPLPAKMVTRRRALAFAYADGETIVRLTLAEAKALADLTPDR